MVKYRIKLDFNALLHYCGRVFAVYAVHLPVDEFLQLLGGVFDLRRVQILWQKLNILRHVGDSACVGDDDLLRSVLAEIFKLLEHLIGGAEKYRAASVRVGKLLCSLKNMAVLLILRVEEMHVGRGDDALAHALAEIVDTAVVILKHVSVLNSAVVDKKAVVAYRLNFKVVVERGDLLKLLVGRAVHDRAVKLAHAAGGADKQPLAVLHKQAFGDVGGLVKMLEI